MPRKPTGQLTDMSKVPDSLRDRWREARQAMKDRGPRRNGQHTTMEHVVAALTAARGNVLYASEMLGIARASLYERISRHPPLQQLQAQLLEEKLDSYEGALDYLALEELNPTAILANLNAKGSARGWARGGAPGARIDGSPAAFGTAGDTHYHLHLHGSNSRLADIDDAELERLIAERRAQLANPVTDPDAQDPQPSAVELLPPTRRDRP